MKKFILISSLSASLLLAGSINIKSAEQNPDRESPTKEDVVLSFNSSIAKAKKSVVNISTSKKIKRSLELEEMFDHPLLREFFGHNFKIPQQRRKASSLGSGVIISDDGYIVTNNHVVEDADEILVSLLDNEKEYKAKVIGLDPDSDLAVIKIDAKDLNNISFANSKNLLEGDVVFAIGNPFGVGGTITQGIISALNKSGIGLNNYENFIQTDASINPGNSGGALVDSRGALVGINSAILSRSGGNNGVGFAIPSNMVKNVAKSLIENGKIERGYMGVSIANLSKDLKEVYKNSHGALITSVEDDKPAKEAGLKRGDLIIKIDDKKVHDASELKNIIGSYKPKTKIEITYERDGKIKETSLRLDKNGSSMSSNAKNTFLKGLELSNLDDRTRSKYKIPRDIDGVIVLGISEDAKENADKFSRGDVIVQVEQKTITNIKQLNKTFKDSKRKKLRVWVYRRGYIMPILVK
ncbi:MAG: serine protease [Proteobacteria bacterium]|nr:MAG: serine protease [Pseudomonadota bacterium]